MLVLLVNGRKENFLKRKLPSLLMNKIVKADYCLIRKYKAVRNRKNVGYVTHLEFVPLCIAVFTAFCGRYILVTMTPLKRHHLDC